MATQRQEKNGSNNDGEAKSSKRRVRDFKITVLVSGLMAITGACEGIDKKENHIAPKGDKPAGVIEKISEDVTQGQESGDMDIGSDIDGPEADVDEEVSIPTDIDGPEADVDEEVSIPTDIDGPEADVDDVDMDIDTDAPADTGGDSNGPDEADMDFDSDVDDGEVALARNTSKSRKKSTCS